MSSQCFVVTELVDRGFSLPTIVESYEAAVQDMASKIAPIIQMPCEDIEQSIWLSKIFQKETPVACASWDFSAEAVIRAVETNKGILIPVSRKSNYIADNGHSVSGKYKGHLVNWAIHEINKKGECFMDKKFIVSEVIERDISEPAIFSTLEGAQQDMAEKISEAFDVDKDAVLEQILQAEKYPGDVIEDDDEDFSFCGREAFGERHGQNYDWAIHEIG